MNFIPPNGPSRRAWLAFGTATCAFPSLVLGRSVAPEPPPLTLARDAAPGIDPTGYLVSEKFDGVRALWDRSTLRFRSGLPVLAPAWFTERLPRVALDGELWAGRGRFEIMSGLVRRAVARDDEWRAVRYMVFELPGGDSTFASRVNTLRDIVQRSGFDALRAAEQTVVADRAALRRRLAEVVQLGGEGLMLHRADAPYVTGRSDALLKLKPLADAEAVVLGHIAGRGKYTGQLGALWVRNEQGTSFALGSGFSDAQRAAPPAPGTMVTYTYRGTTAGGTPRFATFLRVRSDV